MYIGLIVAASDAVQCTCTYMYVGLLIVFFATSATNIKEAKERENKRNYN